MQFIFRVSAHVYVGQKLQIIHMYVFHSGYAVAQWLGIRLQMLGVAMVTGVSFIAVLEHHFNTVDPGMSCMMMQSSNI